MAETLIYLDHAASTPVRPEVLEAMLPWLRNLQGNPSSLHRAGRRCAQAVKKAREQVAALLGADPREIVFTSGGTEADNLAIAGVLDSFGGRVVTTAIEHHAVLHAARHWSTDGAPIELEVDAEGRVAVDRLVAVDDPDVTLVSVMHGNNETGVLQPVRALAEHCREAGVLFHCDAVQSARHVAIDVGTWPVDLLSLGAHKIGGPKGTGALYVRAGTVLSPQIIGGGQEMKRRAGTENVAGIVGFGVACAIAREARDADHVRLLALRRRLEAGVSARISRSWVNGGGAERLPHIANIGFDGVEGEGILYGLDAEGICVATGSACTSGAAAPSHVLKAMGQSHARGLSAVRLSLGPETTEADVDRALNVLPRVVEALRAESGTYHG